jgi:hypothetical protein
MPGPSLNERGATLPLAIIWVLLLSLGLVAGLNRLSAERRTQANQQAEVQALNLAQSGLSRYLATVSGPPAASVDLTINDLSGGPVAISVRRLRAASGSTHALYVVRAHATASAATRLDHLDPHAQRSVAQLATWIPGSMNVQSAWTSITGLTKNGGAGTISGTDQCGAAAPVAGVAVPTTRQGGGPGYHQNGGASVPRGTPNIAYLGANPAAMAPNINIDWQGIVSGGALNAQHNLTSTAGWPANTSNWPTIYVNNWNSATNTPTNIGLGPGQSGSGLLVIRGNVQLNGSFSWNGVILVGGVLTSNGNNTVSGAVVSGLNVKLGLTVLSSDVGNGTKTFRYNSCHVNSALAGLGGLVPIANAWSDNWPVY